jgi:hypothetical protein
MPKNPLPNKSLNSLPIPNELPEMTVVPAQELANLVQTNRNLYRVIWALAMRQGGRVEVSEEEISLFWQITPSSEMRGPDGAQHPVAIFEASIATPTQPKLE